MNKSKLKSYAPAARRDFIQAVTDRAHFFGLSDEQTVPIEETGDVAIIGGRPFPRIVVAQRKKLEERIKREGFNQVMEAVAYTWFNRFLALRYMELHGYLEHGFRVLSNTSANTLPEILEHATQVELPGLNKQRVTELKLDGNKDAELYRILLVAQCNVLHTSMPFLFERIDDETELLLPDNLLHSDSLIRNLVSEIEEDDWQEVEIIGWLYQFYISEKKDQVIGKVVKSEDIPAATQLFTPNWIVKYMVQNSLGRKWITMYPTSPLRSKMEYYVEPAEQAIEVKAQLTAITPASLDLESLTLLDPACGSGHILVESYDVFKEIYLERGYSNRDFPRLILEKNLYGLDIDDRAAQMAGFALLMKARKDDRNILRSDKPVKLNVMPIQESGDITIENAHWSDQANAIKDLVDIFHYGKTFGSLIQVSVELVEKLSFVEVAIKQAMTSGDLYAVQAAIKLLPLVEQAKVLARKFDCVVANPPYMGSKGMNATLKDYTKSTFPDSKSDLFAMFIERGFGWCSALGINAMVTMQSWMFLSSFQAMREKLLNRKNLVCMVHMGNGVMGIAFGTCASIFQNRHISGYIGSFIYVENSDLNAQNIPKEFPVRNDRTINCRLDDLKNIPGSPIAYWVSNKFRKIFTIGTPFEKIATPRQGLGTTNNDKFVRLWFEVAFDSIGMQAANRGKALNSGKKWYPYNKGGPFRKWYGNNDSVVNWLNDGAEIKKYIKDKNPNVARSETHYFKEGLTWGLITSAIFSCRYMPEGFIFDVGGASAFPQKKDIYYCLGFLNSNLCGNILKCINPSLNTQVGDLQRLPIVRSNVEADNIINNNSQVLIQIAKNDWDSFETSWDFKEFPWLIVPIKSITGAASWERWKLHCNEQIVRMMELEVENNRIFTETYGLQEELTPDVSEDQITLARADRGADMKRLVSYAIGCMMGRYSLDHPGLVYANNGSIGFEQSKYQTFSADDDGIVPVTDMDWFPDDAANRFEEFLKVAWSPEVLEENQKFVADSLSQKNGETPRETIRRYISTQFYKDHLQTYKKRPIYWLFSSGKHQAFECIVYLHRYNESTLSRMRNEYVTPLQGKLSAHADYLSREIGSASSTSARNKLQKQLDSLKKKQAEIAAFDELLRHYADQRISLDLDDGVKVNYGKFGTLLAEVKTITGGNEAE